MKVEKMNQISKRSGKFVVPGSNIGVVEELLPGKGTFVEDGEIRSYTTGSILVDLISRKASVLSKVHKPIVPKVGSIVKGVVTSAQKNADLRIFEVDGKRVGGFFSGLLHISNVSPRFIKTMSDAFKRGDIVRAKVISTANKIFHLTTEEENLGVIQAVCSNCGTLLDKKGYFLQCPNCRKREKRKTVVDYQTKNRC
jgi:exosome complex component CSL4